jgi:ABC-type multidrug transport system ATPase subunit
MTTSILEALIQLFALFAAGRGEEGIALGRTHATRYMRNQLPKKWADESLGRFDELVDQFQRMPARGEDMHAKRLAKLSVKLLRTCSQINKGLEWHEKHVVVVRLLEYLHQVPDLETGRLFLKTVSESFNIDVDTLSAMQSMVVEPVEKSRSSVSGLFEMDDVFLGRRFGGRLIGLHLEEGNLFLLRASDQGGMRVNHQEMQSGMVALLAPGGTLRDNMGGTLFHSELVAHRKRATTLRDPLVLRAEDVSHYFKFPQEQALHQFNLRAEGGQLVGIMGGSGSGKSTLLGVLNGSTQPTFGSVTLNGKDIYSHAHEVVGWIGHVPQEDVLIAELTVRENLEFNAELSLGQLEVLDRSNRIDEVLQQLGLWDVQHLRVGSVLDKVISGGQRKRVNIGLELLRKPPVLFLDEPTSGLSSRDSEQIMDILKELTYAGQLVFAVLHQPSSDLFKMLDRLFLLDQGGHPIYWGNPLDSVRHFNSLASHVHADQCECGTCGNVNPEQLFDVIEAKTVDEYGRKTHTRRTSPKEWNDFYTIMIGNALHPEQVHVRPLERSTQVAGALAQWKTYFKRDVLTKLRNTQYLVVNAMEAPALALLLAGFMRFTAPEGEYTFRASENLPPFLFISVIVALFLGLSVSAEEILRDRSLLKRERFLNVKWHHYVHAKMAVVASVSLVHAFGFALVSHAVLQIPTFLATHTLVLFVVALFGNVLGLIISAWFKTAKVIYIVIPLLVIPQIIFGGAIIRFERFNAMFSEPDAVPWFGNVMASRWGFEAVAVDLARNNPFDTHFSLWEDRIYRAAWRRDFWLAEVRRSSDSLFIKQELDGSASELSSWEGVEFRWPWTNTSEVDWEEVKTRYNTHYGQAFASRNEERSRISNSEDLVALKNASHNDELWEWVLQDNRKHRAVQIDGKVVQKSGPIHRYHDGTAGRHATMYMPFKQVGSMTISTLAYNVLALLGMSTILWLLLLVTPWMKEKGWRGVNLPTSSPQV